MIWLAALTSALSLQNAEPVTVECQLSWEQAGRRWTPAFTCPPDAPDAQALQSAAATILERTRTPIESAYPLRGRAISFVMTADGWDLGEITPLHRAPPSYPPSAVGNGVAARCQGRVELRENGSRRRDNWVCLTNHEDGPNRFAREFARAATNAVRNSYWLVPLNSAAPCTEIDFEFNTQRPDGSPSRAPEFAETEFPQCPA